MEGICEPRWARLIIEAPPPPGPHLAKDVNIFTYMSNLLSIVFHCVHMYLV